MRLNSTLVKMDDLYCMFYLNLICVEETEPVYCLFCQNGARCEEQGITARCHCADGYYGDGCGK